MVRRPNNYVCNMCGEEFYSSDPNLKKCPLPVQEGSTEVCGGPVFPIDKYKKRKNVDKRGKITTIQLHADTRKELWMLQGNEWGKQKSPEDVIRELLDFYKQHKQ